MHSAERIEKTVNGHWSFVLPPLLVIIILIVIARRIADHEFLYALSLQICAETLEFGHFALHNPGFDRPNLWVI